MANSTKTAERMKVERKTNLSRPLLAKLVPPEPQTRPKPVPFVWIKIATTKRRETTIWRTKRMFFIKVRTGYCSNLY